MRFRIAWMLTAFLIGLTPVAAAELLVREFRGIGQTQTEPFYVDSPWLIEWWSRPPSAIDQKPAHLEVYLYNASTNEFIGRVARHAGVGRGEMLIEHSGRFRLRIQGQATNWELKIFKIDEEFAERLRETRLKPPEPPRRLGW
jgi:hypothetical protein